MKTDKTSSRGLLFDITVIGVISVVISLTLTSLFFQYSISRYFDQYVKKTEDVENHRITQSIEDMIGTVSDLYQASEELNHLAMVMDVSLQISDNNGKIVFTSEDRQTHMSAMAHPEQYSMYHSPYPLSTTDETVHLASEANVNVKITHYKQEGIWTSEDLWFKSRVIGSIALSGAVSIILLMPFIYFFSTKITKPLMALAKATSMVSQGQSSKPVEVTANNEIKTLAQAFNDMLSKLKTVEGLRKKLISDMAHELRTPLGNLQNFLEAMEDGVIPNSQDNIAKAKNEANRLISLVNSIQELTLAESKVMNLQKTKNDITNILVDVSGILQPLFEEKGIDFKAEIPDYPVIAEIDVQGVYRAIHNILFNAYNYTNTIGQVKLRAWVEHDTIKISVKDTGIGIPEQDIPFVFERFYRVDPSRSRKTGGTGLGLAITKELIEAHGGTVSVKSQYEVGTEFIITLPITITGTK